LNAVIITQLYSKIKKIKPRLSTFNILLFHAVYSTKNWSLIQSGVIVSLRAKRGHIMPCHCQHIIILKRTSQYAHCEYSAAILVCVIASEAWQSRKKDGMGCGVIASLAWQSRRVNACLFIKLPLLLGWQFLAVILHKTGNRSFSRDSRRLPDEHFFWMSPASPELSIRFL